MKGILHGTGDKRGAKAPAAVDVPASQAKGGAVKVPRKKRPLKLKGG